MPGKALKVFNDNTIIPVNSAEIRMDSINSLYGVPVIYVKCHKMQDRSPANIGQYLKFKELCDSLSELYRTVPVNTVVFSSDIFEFDYFGIMLKFFQNRFGTMFTNIIVERDNVNLNYNEIQLFAINKTNMRFNAVNKEIQQIEGLPKKRDWALGDITSFITNNQTNLITFYCVTFERFKKVMEIIENVYKLTSSVKDRFNIVIAFNNNFDKVQNLYFSKNFYYRSNIKIQKAF